MFVLSSNKLELLFEFVKQQHGEAVRKYTNEPYFMHPFRVAEILSSVTQEEHMIAIALCHDLIDDTDCTISVLKIKLKEFGFSSANTRFICNGVMYLSDYYVKSIFPEINRKKRKQWEAKRLWSIPDWAQTIKYADIIDNSENIEKLDPKFSKIYLPEKKLILSRMQLGNPVLLRKALEIVNK